MGSDLYMSPPAEDVYVLIVNTAGKGAIYRYQADGIYNYASSDWILVQRLGPQEAKHVAKAFQTVKLQVEATLTSNTLPDVMLRGTMREILSRRTDAERRERKVADDLAALRRLQEQYPDVKPGDPDEGFGN